jgi:SSS family solute:Na+ symporter
MIVGVVAAIALYVGGVKNIAGVNPGLLSLGLNLAIVFGWSLLSPGPDRSPVATESSAPASVAGQARLDSVS